MSNVTPPLQGRRILVTGAATGIGAAAVRVLTEAGAEIVATYHQTPPPDDLVATWLQCDARDPDAVSTTVQQAAERLGGLDVLVNAAGLWQAGIPGYIGADDISFLLDTNVKATILTNQAAYAVMKAARAAGSSTSDPPKPLWAARSRPSTPRRRARFRRGPDPPPAPGRPTMSPSTLWRRRCRHPGADRLRDFLGPEAAGLIDQQMKMMIPLGGALGDPARDVGPILIFLAGAGSGFITGQLLAVDGGLIMVGG